MIRRPPRSPPFPTRRSSDLLPAPASVVRPHRPRLAAPPARDEPARAIGRAAGARPGPHHLARRPAAAARSEEHTSELQSHLNLVCRLLLEKKKTATGARVDT